MVDRVCRTVGFAAVLGTWLVTAADHTGGAGEQWDLQRCVDQALAHNIQVRRLSLDSLSSFQLYRQAVAAQFPGVSVGMQYALTPQVGIHGFGDLPWDGRFDQSGRYSLNASWTVFKGGSIRDDVREKRLAVDQAGAGVRSTRLDITISVVNAYLQVLYSQEALKSAEQALESTRSQRNRTAELLAVGSASKVDLAHLDAQAAADEYNRIVAENTLAQRRRDLQQLLDLPAASPIALRTPEAADSSSVPPLDTVYAAALAYMPSIDGGMLDKKIAELEVKKATAGYMPSLSVSAGLSTANTFGNGGPFSSQLSDNFDVNVGVSLSVPVWDNRRTKTTVENARIGLRRAELSLEEAKNSLRKTVESAYFDAQAARSKLAAADLQLETAGQSYAIAVEQFGLGLLHSTGLLVERNAYLSAQQARLQAKYSALFLSRILNLYMGRPIAL